MGIPNTAIGRIKTFMVNMAEEAKKKAKELAQDYEASDIPEAVKDFGDRATKWGGNVGTAGMGMVGVGAASAATGIGVVPGAAIGAAGAATSIVGGVVYGVGAAAQAGATLLDGASAAIRTGNMTPLINSAKSAATNTAMNAVEKKLHAKLPANKAAAHPDKPADASKKSGEVAVQSKGKKNVETGKCAEWLAKRDYEDNKYETMQFQNASGQGADLIARDKKTGALTYVEVKGTVTDKAPPLTGLGKKGGEEFMIGAKARMNNGTDADKALLEKLKKWEQGAPKEKPTYNKREVYVDDNGNGCMERSAKDMPIGKDGKPQSPHQDKEWKPTKTRTKK